MNLDIEINPIAISAHSYNLHIANLVEHLLTLDQKMFEAHKTTERQTDPKGAA
jgi:hypothetical protein